MADVRVTYERMPGEITTPAKILREGTQYAIEFTRVCRKIFILSNRTAIATAGNEDCIREFVRLCRERIDEFDTSDRPMRCIGDLADQVGNNDPTNLSVIGAHVRDFENPADISLNSLSPGIHMAELEYLGRCVAIGSGAEQLLREIELRDRDIRSMPPEKQQYVYAQIFGACSAINAQRMIDETNPTIATQSWGHFLEYAYFNVEERKWERQKRQAYLYLVAGTCEDGISTAIPLPRFVAYDASDKFGRVAAFSVENNLSGFEWLLDDISQDDGSPSARGYPFWAEWRPELITLTVILLNHEGHQQKITLTLNEHDLKNVSVDISDNRFKLEIEPEFFDKTVGQMLEYVGFFYKSWDEMGVVERKQVRWPINVNFT